jgi:hypothetical protein
MFVYFQTTKQLRNGHLLANNRKRPVKQAEKKNKMFDRKLIFRQTMYDEG